MEALLLLLLSIGGLGSLVQVRGCTFYASPSNLTSVFDTASSSPETVFICLTEGIYQGSVGVNNSKVGPFFIKGINDVNVPILRNLIIHPLSMVSDPTFVLEIRQVVCNSLSILSTPYNVSFPRVELSDIRVESNYEDELFNNTFRLEALNLYVHNLRVVGNRKTPYFIFNVPIDSDHNSIVSLDEIVWMDNNNATEAGGGMVYTGYPKSISLTDSIFSNNTLTLSTANPFLSGDLKGNKFVTVMIRNLTVSYNLWYNNNYLFHFSNGEFVTVQHVNVSCNPFTNNVTNHTLQGSFYPPFFSTNVTITDDISIPSLCPLSCPRGSAITSSIFQCISCPMATTPTDDYGSCLKCPANTFSRNNRLCKPCPPYTQQTREGMSSCFCIWGGIEVDDRNQMACSNVVFWMVVGILGVIGILLVSTLAKVWQDSRPISGTGYRSIP